MTILSSPVEYYAQGLLAHLVGGFGDAYCALCGRKRLVPREEAEALGFLPEQHCPEVAVPKAHIARVRHGAWNAKRLQAYTDVFGGFRGAL